jgi:hypothetical protein
MAARAAKQPQRRLELSKKQLLDLFAKNGARDGARTRDLRRDRPAL